MTNRETIIDGIRVVYTDGLPELVQGLVSYPAWAETPVILINSNYPEGSQRETLEHELRHFQRGDLNNAEASIMELERDNVV